MNMIQKKKDPFELFAKWLKQAKKHKKIVEPTAMILATANKKRQPSARTVLLKGFDERGFVFFTNYTSTKAHDLSENPKAGLCFFWQALGRQVLIKGRVEKTSDKESDDYFDVRPRGSQIGAWSSNQSAVMKTPDALVARVAEITKMFAGEVIPRPPFWGGFRVVPTSIEFWQEGEFRLHTRLRYRKMKSGKWKTELLFP